MIKIVDKCTLCDKVLKSNSEETCEGDECEGEYEFRNDSDLIFNFCKDCRKILEKKDGEHNTWRNKWKYSSEGTYKAWQL